VLPRLQQHSLEIQPVCRLKIGTLGDRDPRAPQPFGELVADPLELAQVEHAWIGPGIGRARRQTTHRERGDKRIGQLALEPRDLRPQRTPCRQLVAPDDERLRRRAIRHLYRIHLPLEEIHGSLPKQSLKLTTGPRGR
jgi:hypothetical protein